ncbi:uncharacterized protein PHALS_11474 [Plasmopara halstedii]|uniref:Coilin N-terminal domain-containing protein n=1 Tax=Plasmopara halstedii TaxID=4781 RepID=A0A0N7L3D9_PLAHL|nr:uncharacterized protein PHALS_11474 [Plasmopara halstedii]CEG35603.1 hypothetical protein PHALS_11474 [Plasmopara halstedii]|eukprot:XP_024571972.1 hypothetical protein PHALS_11474 [Plasmopara halstedii]
MNVRVRLVFTDEVGRHVQRRYGFSSCWYLVPHDAKLVGDMSYALLREFELHKRCSMGLEMRLEELPLLATQSIRIVRDNDTITVDCPLIGDKTNRFLTDSESEVEKPRKRKRKLSKMELKQSIKKMRAPKDRKKVVKSRSKADTESCRITAQKRIEVQSSSSSSSCDSSSSECSNETSENNESEDKFPPQVSRPPIKDVSLAKVLMGSESKATAPAQTKNKSRRRRRRLRQRNRKRQKKRTEVNNTSLVQLPAKDIALPQQDSASSVTKRGNMASSVDIQIGGSTAGPRGYPRAKSHVLFDEITGEQTSIEHDPEVVESKTDNWIAKRLPAPELAKYGPASSSYQRYKSLSQTHQTASSFSQIVESDEISKVSYSGNDHKRNSKHGERWKRSYEIVATVLDEKTQDSNENYTKALNLSNALIIFPAASANISRFALKDVIAYKTLTLCLETCQPVLSDWKCGQVQSTNATCTILELSSWDLKVKDESVTFQKSPDNELYSVQVSDITELRYLSGPSYTALHTVS